MFSLNLRRLTPIVACGWIIVAAVVFAALSCAPISAEDIKSDSKAGWGPEKFKPYQLVNTTDQRALLSPPNGAICYIETQGTNGYYGMGTGFMLASNVVMTAAHIIHPILPNGNHVTSITIYPSCNGVLDSSQSDGPPPANWSPNPNWVSSGGTQSMYDYGTIVLTKSFNNIAPLHLLKFDPNTMTNATVTGYPDSSDSPRPNPYHSLCQYYENGQIVGNDPGNYIYYAIDTSNGDSGSPVFLQGSQSVIGLHIKSGGSQTLMGKKYNIGIMMSTSTIEYLENFLKKHAAS